MGARIEISVEEYNAFKERIKFLEEECVKKDKEIEILSQNNGIYKDIFTYVFEEITSMERIFQWKYVKKAVNESLGK